MKVKFYVQEHQKNKAPGDSLTITIFVACLNVDGHKFADLDLNLAIIEQLPLYVMRYTTGSGEERTFPRMSRVYTPTQPGFYMPEDLVNHVPLCHGKMRKILAAWAYTIELPDLLMLIEESVRTALEAEPSVNTF